MRLEFGHHLPHQNFDKKGSIRDLGESGLIDMSAPRFKCNSSGFQLQVRSADVSKNQNNEADMMIDESCGSNGNLMIIAELRKKVLTFRDIMNFPPHDQAGALNELVIGTVEDIQKLYPTNVPHTPMLDTEDTPLHQALVHLYNALKSVGDSWANNHKWIADFGNKAEGSLKNFDLEQLGGRVLEKLTYMIRIARKKYDIMDEDKRNNERTEDCNMEDIHSESDSDDKVTTSAPPELTFSLIFFPPMLLPIRLQEVEDIAKKPIATNTMPKISNFISNLMAKVKEQVVAPKPPPSNPSQSVSVAEPSAKLNSNMMPKAKEQEIAPSMLPSPPSDLHSNATTPPPLSSTGSVPPPRSPLPSTGSVPPPRSPLPSTGSVPPPRSPLPSTGSVPPPPTLPSTGSVPPPPPLAPMAMTTGAAPPPPPPLGVAKALRPRKTNNKLKRSTHMGNLYQTLKRKLEGSGLQGKNSQGRKSAIGGSAGEKQGMADALAEMTKRSAYFQQIEEDVQKHEKLIMEMKVSINSFQTKDMDELLKFQKHVEENLEELTDETQVLARFEDFPTKKLETLRMASALYLKLKGISTDLQNWKVAPPLGQLLDKVEAYFNKIKQDLDALERNKEDESKLFQSHNIYFDFNIFTQIKESMVDVSSSCMELALRERRQAKAAAANAETGCQTKGTTQACAKMLWKAFQLAFRVYTFAGGQDDRADKLTKELAHEIENDPEHK